MPSVFIEPLVQPQGGGTEVDGKGGGLFPAQSVAGDCGAAVGCRGREKGSWFWLGKWGMGFEGWVGVQQRRLMPSQPAGKSQGRKFSVMPREGLVGSPSFPPESTPWDSPAGKAWSL